MPKPDPKESKDSFIARAIKEFMNEGYDQKEAIGRAYGFWKTYSKSKKK